MTTAATAHAVPRKSDVARRSLGALVVAVHVHPDEASWWAETPDYPGLTVVAPSREELMDRIRPAIEFHLEECGVAFEPTALSFYIIQPLETTT